MPGARRAWSCSLEPGNSFPGKSIKETANNPYGPTPSGWIMYHPDGNMCVAIMRPDRPKFVSNNAVGGTPDEIKAAFEGYFSYCGSYEVNKQEAFVIHRIQVSSFPNWLATEQKRFFEIAGDRITLSTSPITGFGGTEVHRLVW